MLENINALYRGRRKAAGRGFRAPKEIGFTMVSISISLVAVLIPLLLMGASSAACSVNSPVTLAMTIFVSIGGFADADADDGLALPACT